MKEMSKLEKMMLKNKYSFSNQINIPQKPGRLSSYPESGENDDLKIKKQ
jgi:hypothetical protein